MTDTEPEHSVVCVVDDDADIRDSLRFLLEDERYEVEEAENGASALTLLREFPRPRVMLLDRMMTRLDGAATLRQLADDPDLLRRTVIVFMTARGDPPDSELGELLHRYTVATITKPFNLDVLLAAVDHASQQLARDGAAT